MIDATGWFFICLLGVCIAALLYGLFVDRNPEQRVETEKRRRYFETIANLTFERRPPAADILRQSLSDVQFIGCWDLSDTEHERHAAYLRQWAIEGPRTFIADDRSAHHGLAANFADALDIIRRLPLLSPDAERHESYLRQLEFES